MTEDLNIRNESVEEFYDISEEIGSGQFAVVKKLLEKSSGDSFAAKFIKKKRSKSLRRGMTTEQILREASVLRSVNHTGIIYLHDIYETKLEFILVLELLSGGELFEFLSEQEYLTEDEAVEFLKQAIEAIGYLHQKSIVHLDIKPENIVLKSEGSNHIKLIDFGLARKLTKGEMVREIMGTPEFVAPEIIAFEPVGAETDMWAVGVLTYIMLSGASPFLGDNDSETFNNIAHVDYEFDDEYFNDISAPAKEFISDLLLKETRERMTAGECLKHEWMQEQNSSGESEEDDDVDSLPVVKTGKPKGEAKTRRSTLIKTEAFKKFTARAHWQKSVNKLIAISRLALLGKKNGPLSKGVLLQPNGSDDASSDTDNNNQAKSIPLEQLEHSDRDSTAQSINEDDSVCSTVPAKPLNEESQEKTITTENGVGDKRQNHEDEENGSRNDETGDQVEQNNIVTVPKSRTGLVNKNYSNRDIDEQRAKLSDSLDNENNLDERKSGIVKKAETSYKKEKENPVSTEKTLDKNESEIVEASGERVDKSYKKEQEKPVLPKEKPAHPVSNSSVNPTIDAGEKQSIWKHVVPRVETVVPRVETVVPRVETVSERRQYDYKNPHDIKPRSPQSNRKNSDISTERKQDINPRSPQSNRKNSDISTERQQDINPRKKFWSHNRNREDKAVTKTEPVKMKTGKLESLISKFSKPFSSSEGDSKKNRYTKQERRLTSGIVGSTRNEEFGEPRTRRKSDQTGSRVDWRVVRAGRDERPKTDSTKINQLQRSEGLAQSNLSKIEAKGSGALARAALIDKVERSQSPTFKKDSTEKTVVTNVTKTEIRKTVPSRRLDDGAVEDNQDDSSIWVRRSTTSKIERTTKRDFLGTRRGELGLRRTSAKAEVMKWEQRSNRVDSSNPKRPASSPLAKRSATRKEEIATPIHSTTVTMNTKDKRKILPGEGAEMEAIVKDREHTLFVQTSVPLQRTEKSESQRESVKIGRDTDTQTENQERKVKRTSENTKNAKPLVEKPGKPRNQVEESEHETPRTEHGFAINKIEKVKSEVQTEIQSGKASMFPEFALTFQKILPAEYEEDLPEDDDFVWVMTSETNPNMELLASVMAPNLHKSRRSSSSKCDSEGSRRRSSKSSEAETEPTLRVGSGGRSSKLSKEGIEPTILVDSGDSKSSKLDKSSDKPLQVSTIQLGSAVTTVNFQINTLKLN